jgi:hypothetical protein
MTFWNKVQSSVSRAAAEAEKQAKNARVNLAIGEVEGTIRRHKQELSAKALELIRAGTVTEPSLQAIVGSITQQEGRLTELRRELGEGQPAPAAAAEEAAPTAPET